MNDATEPKQARRGGPRSEAVIAWIRLMRVYQEIDHRTAEWLRSRDLSVAQFDVLAQVGAREGLSQQELADALMVTKGNVCQLLDRMQAKGLVERRPALSGRGNALFLTAAGRCLANEVTPRQEALVDEWFASLSVNEQRQLARLLRKVDRGFAPLA